MMSFDDLPEVSVRPADAEPSLIRKLLVDSSTSRRRVIKLFTQAGVAAGLGAVGSIPLSRPRAAYAAPYELWDGDCRGYWSSSTICVPTSAYYGSDNCSGVWHREGTVNSGCERVTYTHYGTTCDGRNAWIWRGRGDSAMCSDGSRSVYNACTGAEFSAFSICRTDPDDTTPPPTVEEGFYNLRNAGRTAYLDGSNSSRVDWNSSAGADTVWELIDAGNGYIYLRHAETGRYLNYATSSTVNTVSSPGTSAQWELIAIDGNFLIRSRTSGRNLDTDSSGVVDTDPGTVSDKQWRFETAAPTPPPTTTTTTAPTTTTTAPTTTTTAAPTTTTPTTTQPTTTTTTTAPTTSTTRGNRGRRRRPNRR